MTNGAATRTNRFVRRVRGVVVVATSPPAHAAPARRRAWGAAVAVVLGFAVAAGAQLGIGCLVRTNPEAFADPQYHDKLELLRKCPATPGGPGQPLTLLFLGSSRTFDAINAGAAAATLARDLGGPVTAFNFAHSGAGPVTTAVYLRRLLQDGTRPDAVVIEVHPAFLAEQVTPPFETRWLNPLRLRPGEDRFVRELGLPVNEPAAHGPRGLWLAGYEYRVHLLERYAPVLSPRYFRLVIGAETDAHGFVRVPELLERQRPRLRTWVRRQYADCWADFRPGGSGLKGLRDVLTTCRSAGIRSALLITPESAELQSWYAEPGRSRIAPVVGALANEFGAPLFDARGWVPDEFIIDGHHLTGDGADLFTDRLVREAVSPWLRSPFAGGEP